MPFNHRKLTVCFTKLGHYPSFLDRSTNGCYTTPRTTPSHNFHSRFFLKRGNSVLFTLNRFSVTNPKERYLMKKMNSLQAMLCMVFVVACLHISALGQSAEDKNNLAAIRGSGSSVRWDVAAPYSSLTMTVSAPDGRVFRREFKAGSTPEFTIIDNKGERLPDGQYNYELRLTPVFSSGVIEELASARAKEDAEAARDTSKRGAVTEALMQKDD